MTLPVFVNSVPKAGTHLLKRCLLSLHGVWDAHRHLDISQPERAVAEGLRTLLPGGLATGHLPFVPAYRAAVAQAGAAHLLMLRDPRDVALSLAEYIPRLESHYLHETFRGLDPDQRLLLCIEGLAEPRPEWDDVALRDIGSAFREFTAWRAEPTVTLVRFEDLVGPAGGGDAERQLACVRRVAQAIGSEFDAAAVERAAQRTFDRASPTFREGAAGAWRERFTPAHRQAFERVGLDLLAELGYPAS